MTLELTTPKTLWSQPASTDESAEFMERLPVHLAVLVNFVPPHARPVFEELARHVGRLTILVSTPMEPNRQWAPEWGDLNVQVQRTWTIRRPWRHPLRFHEKLFIHVPWDTLGQLRRLRPDVVLSAELGWRTLFCALHRRIHGTPLAISTGLSEHTEQGRGAIRAMLRRWLARHSDSVGVNGSSGARYLQRIGFHRDQLFHLPYAHVPGFDLEPVDRDPAIAHRLLYCGNLTERKGVMPFLTALCQWGTRHPDRHAELWLAGSGDLETAIARYQLPVNVSVRLLGWRRYEELAPLFREAGILVFPTLSDEWGLVVNEALASGLPVLGSRYGQSVEELCIEGQTGWVFRTDDAAEMYAAIDRALNTPIAELNRMRLAARRRVEGITPRAVAVRMLELVRQALSRRGHA